jgi:hypothetical protein
MNYITEEFAKNGTVSMKKQIVLTGAVKNN